MIGDAYWSTGITFGPRQDGLWMVSLDFHDDGFAEEGVTEGTLRCRYQGLDLAGMIDTLKADAERLGIRWLNPGLPEEERWGTAAVYVERDGELEDGDRPDLRRIANEQARRLGWRGIYSRDGEAAPAEQLAAEDRNEVFDAAIVRFLNERAGSARDVDWKVDVDDELEWEVRLWLDGEFAGTFRVTEDGSEPLTDAGAEP